MKKPLPDVTDKKRILVTAANGFGRYIVDAFQRQGYEVITIARNEERKQHALAKNPSLDPDQVIVADLANLNTMTTEAKEFWEKLLREHHIDGVVNNAMVTPKNSETRPTDRNQRKTIQVNTYTAVILFRACAAMGIPIIQQSTHNAHIKNPRHDEYRATKQIATSNFKRLVETDGLKGVVVEPGMMVAPGSGHYRMEVLASMPVNMKLLQGAGMMQPISHRDVSKAMVGMMENLWDNSPDIENGKIYKAAGHTPMTLGEYLDSIREAMGIDKRKRVPVPIFLRSSERFMNLNARLPFSPFGSIDGFDVQDLRRDFTVDEEEVASFMRAGKLKKLRDPAEDFREYAAAHGPFSPMGALFAYLGLDIETYWKSVKEARVTKEFPALGAPTRDEIRAARTAREITDTRRTVLVVGATGFIGPVLVQELLASGHNVVCAVRNPDKARKEIPYPGVKFILADLNEDRDPELWKARLEKNHIDCVINNSGIEKSTRNQNIDDVNVNAPRAIAQACTELGAERTEPLRFVQMSTGILDSDLDHDRYPYPRTKKAMENALQEMPGDLDWVIVRPNYVFEPRRGHVKFEDVAQMPMVVFTHDGAKQPISTRDLAIGVSRLVEPGSLATHITLGAAGNENMRWKDFLDCVNNATGGTLKYTPTIPRAMATTGIRLKQLLPEPAIELLARFLKVDAEVVSRLDPDMFETLCAATATDNTLWKQHTGIRPTGAGHEYGHYVKGEESYRRHYRTQRSVWRLSPDSDTEQGPGGASR